ncbi:MAG: hypothetical protein ABR992_07345 [Solirubrobacteraceae bacterium]|jgi:hypothetical protein
MTDTRCGSLAWLRAALAVAAALVVLVAVSSARATPATGLDPELSVAGLGQPTMLTANLGFEGTEYDGSPPPLTHLKLTLPAGMGGGGSGFSSCEISTLETSPADCPPSSRAGADSLSSMFVDFGGERVEEDIEVRPFFGPGDDLSFFLDGHSPVSLEMIVRGTLLGNVLTLAFPLVETVPGEPYVSFKVLALNLGIAHVVDGASIYSLRMPEECPQGKFTWDAEAEFATNEDIDREVEKGLATAETACPEHSSNESSLPGTEGVIVAPSNKQCVSRRDFIIHIQQIKGVSYRSASVYVNSNPVDVLKGARFHARVDLRGLPKGRYTVKITVTTASGRQITGTRAYHTCAPKPLPSGKPRL